MPTLHKIISATNVVEQICTTGGLYSFNYAKFFAFTGFVNTLPVNNRSGVYIGENTTELPIVLTSGLSYEVGPLQHKSKDDLSNYYIRGNAGDAVYIITKN